jgi:hypothetical protein
MTCWHVTEGRRRANRVDAADNHDDQPRNALLFHQAGKVTTQPGLHTVDSINVLFDTPE